MSLYRGTSLKRKRLALGPDSRSSSRGHTTFLGGEAFSYERGTPVIAHLRDLRFCTCRGASLIGNRTPSL